MESADQNHAGSCALARIALAVWRVKPEAFYGVHRKFLAGDQTGEPEAMEWAMKALAGADLEAVLEDPWIDEVIRANVEDWLAMSRNARKLPKLLISDRRILHGLPSGEADFIRVMELELGL